MTALVDELVYFPDLPELTRLDQLHRAQTRPGETQGADGGPWVRPVGDCWRTSIACILGASAPTFVPHFADMVEDLDTQVPLGWETLRIARHWMRAELELDLFPLELDAAADTGRPFIASARSRTGPWWHVLVCQGRTVVHDTAAHHATDGQPYTWQDVLDGLDGSVLMVTLPYNPGPDAQMANWILAARADDLDSRDPEEVR
ncbi:MAG TPA: hypothetical protein P5193_04495 [Microthrixaceae bacterium]|mgnify:CR=1 FL=1|nr:hypothetical protein [Microthrixaceae bacterium]